MKDLALANEGMSGEIGGMFLLGRHVPGKARTRLVEVRQKAAVQQIGFDLARVNAGLDLLTNVHGILIKLVSAVNGGAAFRSHNGLVAEGKIEVLDYCAYIAVKRSKSKELVNILKKEKIKKQSFIVAVSR